MPEEDDKKPESIWKFYFQARWQTGLTSHFLLGLVYLALFYAGNLWAAFKFTFFTFVASARLLGIEFAFWGLVFILSSVLPFIACWYAIFLLPKIWRNPTGILQKVFLTAVLLVAVPVFIIFADTLARYAINTNVLREFVNVHNIQI